MSTTIVRQIELSVTAKDLAIAFCDMTSDAQAEFFAEVAEELKSWGSFQRNQQVLHIAEDLRYLERARELILEIADELRASSSGGTKP